MVDLKAFQETLRDYYAQVFIVDRVSKQLRKATQADLAAQSGMSAENLSRKLNGHVKFQERDVRNIIRTLTNWEAITSRGQAQHLLDLMAYSHFDQVDWKSEPLNKLKLDVDEIKSLVELKSDKGAAIQSDEVVAQQAYQPPFDEELLLLPEHFLGREEDLQWLQSRLRAGGTTSITALGGMGGIGKTALAAKAIRSMRAEGHFRDGIAVEFCLFQTDANKIVRKVLSRFDHQRREPETNDLSLLIDVAHRLLKGKDALVVLDNVEPGLDLERVMIPLRAASIAVLLTARQKLPRTVVSVDASWSLDLLPFKVASDLFIRSFGRQASHKLNPPEYVAVEKIVKVLERHTLAVKLAGAYAMDCTRDLLELSEELQDPQQALELPDGETPRAVALAFARSVDALSQDARKLFVTLAAFGTVGFGRRAALALGEVMKLTSPATSLDLLIRRALVEVWVNDEMPERTDRERQRFHPLIWAFAAQEFNTWPQDERNVIHRAIATYYSHYANNLNSVALGIDEINIISALEWAYSTGENLLVALLCLCVHVFWRDRARTSEILHYLPWGMAAAEVISEATNRREDRLRAATLALTYGQVLRDVGKLDEAEQRLQQLRDIFHRESDQQGEGEAFAALGQIARLRGRLEEAGEYYEQSLPLLRLVRDQRGEGEILTYLGQIAKDSGQLEKAQLYYEQSLNIQRELQNWRGQGWNLSYLGRIAHYREQMQQAELYYQEALLIHHKVQDRRSEAWVLGWLGQIAMVRGRIDEAERYYQEALALHRQIQDRRGEATIPHLLGRVAEIRGQLKKAEAFYEQSLEIFREIQDNRSIGWRLCDRGRIAHTRNRLEHAKSQLEIARSCYEQSLALLRKVHDRQGEAEVLTYFGWFALTSGELDDGNELLQQALIIQREVEYKSGECLTLSLLSEVASERGQYDVADDLFTQCLRMARSGENRLLLCRLLSSGASLALARGDLERAASFSHESQGILADIQSNLDIANAILSFSP
jgi:tetratricopeptide (TPR) repeat protein